MLVENNSPTLVDNGCQKNVDANTLLRKLAHANRYRRSIYTLHHQ